MLKTGRKEHNLGRSDALSLSLVCVCVLCGENKILQLLCPKAVTMINLFWRAIIILLPQLMSLNASCFATTVILPFVIFVLFNGWEAVVVSYSSYY